VVPGETGWLNRSASGAELAELMARVIERPPEVADLRRRLREHRPPAVRPFEDHVDELAGDGRAHAELPVAIRAVHVVVPGEDRDRAQVRSQRSSGPTRSRGGRRWRRSPSSGPGSAGRPRAPSSATPTNAPSKRSSRRTVSAWEGVVLRLGHFGQVDVVLGGAACHGSTEIRWRPRQPRPGRRQVAHGGEMVRASAGRGRAEARRLQPRGERRQSGAHRLVLGSEREVPREHVMEHDRHA
jgi:hypothetical protein